ncbi:MAG: alpha/beta hydrolase [Bacillota bacterium]
MNGAGASAWRRCLIPNKRGEGLAALLSEAASGRAEHTAMPLVVVCHGFTGSKEGGGHALRMGEVLWTAGFSTLLFDFTGCGESEGVWEEISLSRQVADLSAVVDWCRDKGFHRVVLNGRSFGGTTVLCYAARDREIAAVSTWAASAGPAALFAGLAAGEPRDPAAAELSLTVEEGNTVYLRKAFLDDLLLHDVLRSAARIAPRPLQVIHGSADEVVPAGDARLLYQAAAAPKELILIEGADHRFSAHHSAVWRTFTHWLQRVLPP